MRALGRQVAGRQVGAVVQTRDRILHLLARAVPYVGLSIDDTGNSLDRDTGQLGDVIDGGGVHGVTACTLRGITI